MRVFTYSEARQNLATLLDIAQRDGAVIIRRRDGQSFVLRPEVRKGSPLDVEPVSMNITADEIVQIVREGREQLEMP